MLGFEEAGATAAQQLGYGVAAGVEYLDGMTSKGSRCWPSHCRALSFSVAIGSSYFFEIAKLRALRLLWSRVVESFGGKGSEAKNRHIRPHVALEHNHLRPARQCTEGDNGSHVGRHRRRRFHLRGSRLTNPMQNLAKPAAAWRVTHRLS